MAKKKRDLAGTPIDDLVAKINKKYGYEAIGLASEARSLDIDRLQTGIFPIDRATGGGIPKGCIVEFYGPKQSGKSFLALKLIISGQNTCRDRKR